MAEEYLKWISRKIVEWAVVDMTKDTAGVPFGVGTRQGAGEGVPGGWRAAVDGVTGPVQHHRGVVSVERRVLFFHPATHTQPVRAALKPAIGLWSQSTIVCFHS
jgi:hypothetical protein